MNNVLFIPKKIKVGYQERNDTYTKKLAYIIYYDAKGALRKKASWETWRYKYKDPDVFEVEKRKTYDAAIKNYMRYGYDEDRAKQAIGTYENYKMPGYKWSDDKSIEPKDFDNIPTEGFVLNKKVGGHNSGFNHRQTYIRVYDPRGFEFEITIPNLLFILQETSCVKGKGLEGEFVYSWSGTELVLLPVGCEEYKKSVLYTELQSQKITVKDLVPGCTYRTKETTLLTYIGKFDFYEFKDVNSYRGISYGNKNTVVSNTHIFVDDNGKYHTFNSLVKFARKESENPLDSYADLLDKFYQSKYSSKPIAIEKTQEEVAIEVDGDQPNYQSSIKGDYYLGDDNAYVQYNIIRFPTTSYEENKYVVKDCKYSPVGVTDYVLKDGVLSCTHLNTDYNLLKTIAKDKEQISKMKFNKIAVVLENGLKLELNEY